MKRLVSLLVLSRIRSDLPRLAVVFLLALPLIGGATAHAQVLPPSLTGEVLGAQCSSFPPSFTCNNTGQGSVTTTCALQSDGTAVLNFSVTGGVATGPYPGSFSESGAYTLAPQAGGGERVTGFSSNFNIQSPVGSVTGTKSFNPALQGAGFNTCTAFSGQFSTFAGAAESYDATIQTAQGTFRDTGQGVAQTGASPPFLPTGFFENFTSTTGVVVPGCDEDAQVDQAQIGNDQGCANP